MDLMVPECGKLWKRYGINVESWNTYRKYGIHIEEIWNTYGKIWNKYEQSLALGQATKLLQLPQGWAHCMFTPLLNPYS